MPNRPVTFFVLICCAILHAMPAQSQVIPREIQQELAARNMTAEEARIYARRYNVDLSRPEEAATRLRELGVPDRFIQQMLDAQAPMSVHPAVLPVRRDTLELTEPVYVDTTRSVADEPEPAAFEQRLPYFGYDLFQNVPESFQPGAAPAISDDHVVGPEDELRLIVWGAAEFQYDLPVDMNGRIFIPSVGQYTVAGRSLSTLRRDLKIWLSRSYAGLVDNPPSVFMDLSLTRLRPIRLFVLGEVRQPGGYVLPSGSNIFSALYTMGGPLQKGSLRSIKVYRNNVGYDVDLYEYLVYGTANRTIQLQTGDHVFVPPRGRTVHLEGAVYRPAIYEIRGNESFLDVLEIAGGLTANAYTKRFQIERIIPFQERTDPNVAIELLDYDLGAALQSDAIIPLEDGDRISVYSIMDREDIRSWSRIESASVSGAVFQPGRYELGPAVRTIRDLIREADGLTEDAYMKRVELVRLTPDLRREILALDLQAVMNDVPNQNVVLRPHDSLSVVSVFDVSAAQTVSINGAVRNPGEYNLLHGMTVGDLLFQAGGLRDSVFLRDVLTERADLFREGPDARTANILPFDLAAALGGAGMAQELLRPNDEIRIYGASTVEPVATSERFIVVSGAVKEPGQFQYRDGMSIESAILQAGGYTEEARTDVVDVARNYSDEQDDRLAQVVTVPLRGGDLLTGDSGFVLQHRDRISVRNDPGFHEQQVVNIRGEVHIPGDYSLQFRTETLADLISRAGGVRDGGYLGGGKLIRGGEQVIINMEEAIRRPERSIRLLDGDQIIIPPQPNTVAVRGHVGLDGLVTFKPGERVSYYLDRAGGILDRTEAVYLTQPSGATFRVHSGRGLYRTPVVYDGASIVVTAKPPAEDGERIDIGKTVTDIMGILSAALTIIVLSRRASG